jgi:hypothetical protein
MLLYTSFIKPAFHFVLGYQTVNFHILVVPLNKALFFCVQILDIFYGIYPTTYLLHNYH